MSDSYLGLHAFEKRKYRSSFEVITIMKKIFFVHGTPQIFETDNGTIILLKISIFFQFQFFT